MDIYAVSFSDMPEPRFSSERRSWQLLGLRLTPSEGPGMTANALTERRNEPINGSLVMQTAVIAFTVQDAGMKWLLQSHALPELLAIRAGIVLVVATGLLAARRELRRTLMLSRPAPAFGRALLILGAFACYFTALSYMPLADVVAIFFAAPLIQAALSWPVLGEAVGWRRISAIAVGFVGVVVMTGPAGAVYGWPTLAAVGSSVFYAAAMVWSRALGSHATPTQLALATNVAFFVAGGAVTPFVWQTPTGFEAALLVGVALLSFGAHIGLAAAYRLAPVAVVAPLDYTALPLAVVLGVVIWGDWPTWGTVAGVPLVVGAGAYVVWRERQVRRQQLGQA